MRCSFHLRHSARHSCRMTFTSLKYHIFIRTRLVFGSHESLFLYGLSTRLAATRRITSQSMQPSRANGVDMLQDPTCPLRLPIDDANFNASYVFLNDFCDKQNVFGSYLSASESDDAYRTASTLTVCVVALYSSRGTSRWRPQTSPGASHV